MKRAHDMAKDALLKEAVRLADRRSNRTLRLFLELLYAHGAAEDLIAYSAEDLVSFAESALGSMALRTPGIHNIRIYNPGWIEEGDGRKAVTVIEIVNDNMPFLVDSVMQELTVAGIEVLLMVHPIFSVSRGMTGRLLSVSGAEDSDKGRESFIHIHIARLPDAIAAAQLEKRLDLVLSDVRSAVDDWPEMNQRLKRVIEEYRTSPPPLPAEEIAEAIEFLTWLADNNFTFLGLREYDVALATGGDEQIALKPGTGLGLLRDPEVRVLRRGRELVQVTPEVREFMLRPEPLIVAKANVKARVHRHAYMDYVGVKHYDATGRLVSELRLLGLFTSSAYTRSTRSIPYLRRKAAQVMERSGFDPESHSGKALANILENYSRDELFQIDLDTLYDFALTILELNERPRIRVLARREKFNRFVSVLVYVPRDRFNTEIRMRIGDYLKSVYEGRVSASYPAFPEGALARVHYIIGRDDGVTPDPLQSDLEAAVAAITRTWFDDFQDACRTKFGPARGRTLIDAYGQAFSEAYRGTYSPTVATEDLVSLEQFVADRSIVIALRADAPGARVSIRHFQKGRLVPLSVRVPILEAMGFSVLEEKSFEIERADGPIVLHDTTIERADGLPVDLARHGGALHAMFMAVWLKQCESDRLNSLTISAGLGWREIALLRTLSRYLQQIHVPYDQSYIAEALVRNADLAASLVELFAARFAPNLVGNRQEIEAARTASLLAALDKVQSLDEDRIIRRLLNLIEAATRTTFFQIGKDGSAHPVIAVKFNPAKVDGLPAPRPFAEIFMHCPRVEGVHLRFGKVARGGLRWSDRPQDFRTEVLGLVKAQQVKNAVIVPVGAKGGFVPKLLPTGGSRDEIFAEGTEAYKLFVATLIELSDNIVGDAIVPPAHTVRHDGDDPYLVVAADKGTATFSDTANAIADAHDFWLSDAFASGGSVGYDHKKMGITARGAWEAVKRHFREMNVDVQTTPFTVAGVGDMSGDVFGNGMLLSPVIRLKAAFDHRDIFLDPDPDPAVSLAERQRLFALPRSSWADYDRAKISAGGGVFSRSLKSIPLSSEAAAVLGLKAGHVTPQELMAAILRAEVDLLWFGGIGTYVRADEESDAEAGDRANDAIRVTASQLRAKVIGEGANLGMTQRARIAFGLAGGRCNSDAIDNSAGVNSSDVEVNIKIALGSAVRDKRLPIARRNSLLAAMTDDVAALVLANNYRQTLAVSVTHHTGALATPQLADLMASLEARGRLDRKVEFLPDEATLARKIASGEPLSRADIGVLLAYAKIVLFDDLIASDVPDDPMLTGLLHDYFPSAMRQDFAADIDGHRLRREIIATRLVNDMINRGGPAFVSRLAAQTGATVAAVTRAYLSALDVFGWTKLEAGLDALDGRIDGRLQLDLYAALQEFLIDATLWMLRNAAALEHPPLRLKQADRKEVAQTLDAGAISHRADESVRSESAHSGGSAAIERLKDGVATYRNASGVAVPDGAALVGQGLPADLARRLLALPGELSSLDALLVAHDSGATLAEVTAVLATLEDAVGFALLDRQARRLRPTDPLDMRALDLARRSLARSRRLLATRALAADGAIAPPQALDRLRLALGDLSKGTLTLTRLTVAAGLVAELL